MASNTFVTLETEEDIAVSLLDVHVDNISEDVSLGNTNRRVEGYPNTTVQP
jgi:predicted acyl esterase